MKKDGKQMHKILLLIIGVLAIVLAAVLIHKAYQLHQEKVQREEWEVRHMEVQSELEDVQVQIRQLSGDGEALQEFLDEKLNPAIVVEEPEMTGAEEKEPEPETEKEKTETDGNMPEDGVQETMSDSVDAIIIEEPAPPQPQPEEEKTISGNGEIISAPEEIVSENAVPEKPEEDETISGNGLPGDTEADGTQEDETISGNGLPGDAEADGTQEDETISGNGLPGDTEADGTQEDETISGNGLLGDTEADGTQEDETISSNGVQEESRPEGISGNAIVNGQVVPFRYQEASPTLEERRSLRSSYEETLQVNEADKNVISSNTYDFSGKKIACLGDSLTEGSNMDNMEDYKQYSYPSVLKNILGAEEVYNLGIGGSSYGRYWDQAFVDRYKEIPQDTDIIIVMGGTNDGFAASAEELGSMEEKKPRTFYGDVDELMRGLTENYPEAKIIFVTPLPNVLHDYLRNQRDYLLPQSVFADAVKELAAQYPVDVIDLYNSNILDTHDTQVISAFMPDGVHGNIEGYQILAEHFASEIIQIEERDALYDATVSGNTIPAEDENGENAGIVSGNGIIPEDITPAAAMSEEEKAAEMKKAAENNKKAAEAAVIITPEPDSEAEPVSVTNPDSEADTESVTNPGLEADPESDVNPVTEPANENNYEYGGEAIVIQ